MTTTRRPAVAVIGVMAVAIALFTAPAAAQYPTEPPPPGQLRSLQLPPFEEVTLSNGLQVLLVENRELPLVSLSLTMLAGSSYDPQGQEGLAGMVADLLLKGTATRSAEDIAAQIEGVGSSLNAGAGSDFFNLSTTVLKEHTDLAFELMGDVILHSTFPETEVQLSQTRTLSALRAAEAQPTFLASKFFSGELYGDHPYGRIATSASVAGIDRADVVEYAAARLRPGGSILVLAGDISLDEARELAERHFGAWTGTATDDRPTEVPAARATEIVLVNRPGSAQSNILVGNLTMRPGDSDYYSAVVANKVLGGGADARLFMILREEKGWTYGAYSNHNRPQGVGRFQANTEVRTEVTDSALVELLHQIRRMRTEPVSDDELAGAQGFLVGNFPLTIQTPQQIASQVRTVRLLGLEADYLQTYRDRLAAVDADAILDVAGRLMQPDSSVIVVVGDGAKIYDGLAAIAPVRIVAADGKPLTTADLRPSTVALPVNPTRLVARRDSFHVMVQGNMMGTRVSEVTQFGDSVVLEQVIAIPIAGVNQTTRIVLSSALDVRSVDETMSVGPMSGEVHYTFNAGHVVGQGRVPEPQAGDMKDIAVDEPMVPGLTAMGALVVLLPTMDLAEGASFTVMILTASEGTFMPVTITVAATEEITVPAGTFAAIRIEITGTDTPIHMHLSADDHRVLKIVPVGQPVAFELVN